MNYTDGPWTCAPHENCCEWVVEAGDWSVAVVCDDQPGETEATARLIAAAPDLYAALYKLMSNGDLCTQMRKLDEYEPAIAALEKARG